MLNSITLFIGITFMYSTPLIFAALGGVVSERSGVTNLGIEGMMTIGAFTGASVGYFTGNAWAGFLAAGAAGTAPALLHAFASITCKADQIISGIALNLIGPGVALFLCRLLFDGATTSVPVPEKVPKIFGNLKTSGLLKNLNVDATAVLAVLMMVLLWIFLYRTKWGLHVRAVGEHPRAADTMGINVYKVRYLCVAVSGMLAGLGGASMTLAVIPQFTPTAISGQGFIALAAVIFGKWTPHGAYGACLLFGAAQALTIILGGGTFHIPSELLAMLPYVITVFVLIFFAKHQSAPKASGQPYEKGAR